MSPRRARALALQLGPPWCGVEPAAPHVRCLFAVFALHLAERRAEACGCSATSPPLSTRAAARRAIPARDAAATRRKGRTARSCCRLPPSPPLTTLHDEEVSGPPGAVAARHAYTHTALISLLNEARLRAGVLATGQFAWLKLVDRGLWYALHSLGFETEGFGRYLHPNPRVEAVGARDHWAVERTLGEPVGQPSLDRAIEALRKSATAARAAPRPTPPQAGHPAPPVRSLPPQPSCALPAAPAASAPSGGSMPSSRRTWANFFGSASRPSDIMARSADNPASVKNSRGSLSP